MKTVNIKSRNLKLEEINKFVFISLFLPLIVLYPLSSKVFAREFTVQTPETLNIDTSITREDTNFNVPTRVVIVPIFPKFEEAKLSSAELYRGIYYYTVDFLGFNDIPFHYLVSSDGQIFKGNKGGEERRIKINGVGDDMVIIGYMTNKSSARFDFKSEDALTYILTDIVNRRAIPPENIEVIGAKFVRNETAKTVTLESADLFGNWQTNIASIKDKVKAAFNPVAKEYALKLEEVILPSEGVNPGEEASIGLRLTNTSQNGMYAGTDSEILVTKVGEGISQLFLNNIWVSQTQVPLLDDDQILLPNQSAVFDFKVKVPLISGSYSEKFELRTPSGSIVRSDLFDVTLTINPSTKQIVQIRNTETGTLNVRSEPSSVGQVISQVSPGQRFFLLEQDASGFIKIDLGDGTSGWIAGWYVDYIN